MNAHTNMNMGRTCTKVNMAIKSNTTHTNTYLKTHMTTDTKDPHPLPLTQSRNET